MVRVFLIKMDFWFLKAGLFIVENTNGDFYITMDDDDFLDCPVRFEKLVIDGSAVRADKKHFELIREFPDFASFSKHRKDFKNDFHR